jgi:hypothetical protein
VPWTNARHIQQRWAGQFSTVLITPDAIAAAGYLRAHSARGEHVLASNEDPRGLLVGLTERPAFVSRTPLFERLGGTAGALAAQRSHEHATLASVTRFEELRNFGREHGVAWYVLFRGDMPSWPATLTANCRYCGPDIRVFDLR